LLQKVVDLTKDRFNLYHAHIYLLSEIGDMLNLVAGAGEVGRHMVAEGWSIPFEQEQSLVARAARTQQGVTINDVRQDSGFLPNPLLPDTRSEMAVPMIVGDQVLGVLDVQADEVDRFTAEDVRIQTTLASQVAVALQNTRLFAEQQQSGLLLRERVKSLKCLNDIGRKIEETPSIPELLHWVTRRIPQAMQYPELCKVAIEFEDQTYGSSEAMKLPAQMTHGLYIGGARMGRVYIAYTEAHDFLNEESALLGGTATRLSVYFENRRLFEQTQAALDDARQSQELLRSVIDATPDWIFIKDQEHRYRLVNQGYAKALHLSPDDFIGQNDLELGFPEELVKGNPEQNIRGFWADDRLVMDSGETQVYTNDPTTVDGEMHIFHTIKTPLRDAEGNVWGVLAFARDVTERERLLAETETLYQANAKLSVAQSYDDILTVLRQHTIVGLDAQDISLNYFDRPWSKKQTPEWIYALARVSELPAELYTSRYPLAALPPATQLLRPDTPTVFEDMASDPRLDEKARDLYVEKFGAKSSIFAPLVVGGQWIGYINAFYQQPMSFPESEVRRLMALAGQTAVVIQSLRQLEQTTRHAQREQIIRKITEKMRAATSLDQLVKTAAEELGERLSAGHAVVELGIETD
jgi:PAS domain S-box-containing protein